MLPEASVTSRAMSCVPLGSVTVTAVPVMYWQPSASGTCQTALLIFPSSDVDAEAVECYVTTQGRLVGRRQALVCPSASRDNVAQIVGNRQLERDRIQPHERERRGRLREPSGHG